MEESVVAGVARNKHYTQLYIPVRRCVPSAILVGPFLPYIKCLCPQEMYNMLASPQIHKIKLRLGQSNQTLKKKTKVILINHSNLSLQLLTIPLSCAKIPK